MTNRIAYFETNEKATNLLGAIGKHLISVNPKLRALVELRVSQINGCIYCIDLHSEQARKAGETQQRLDTLPAWYESPFFDAREKAALAWAEALTHISNTHAPNDLYQKLYQHFSEQQIVDLTFIIAVMNAWNRISIGFQDKPELRIQQSEGLN